MLRLRKSANHEMAEGYLWPEGCDVEAPRVKIAISSTNNREWIEQDFLLDTACSIPAVLTRSLYQSLGEPPIVGRDFILDLSGNKVELDVCRVNLVVGNLKLTDLPVCVHPREDWAYPLLGQSVAKRVRYMLDDGAAKLLASPDRMVLFRKNR